MQLRRSRVQKCKGERARGHVGTVTRGHEGSREPGSGVRVRVQVQDLNFARHQHLHLNTRARDLGPEDVSTFAPLHKPQAGLLFCTKDRTWCGPYPRQLGQHAVLPLPRDRGHSPDTRYSRLDTLS